MPAIRRQLRFVLLLALFACGCGSLLGLNFEPPEAELHDGRMSDGALDGAPICDQPCVAPEHGSAACVAGRCYANCDMRFRTDGDRCVSYSDVPAFDDFAPRLAIGYGYLCANKQDLSLWCWGSGANGVLGLGGITPQWSPRRVPNVDNVMDVSAGSQHTCAVLFDGRLQCWGDNRYGQLGLGVVGASISTPQNVAAIENVEQVAMNTSHTCVVLRGTGQVWCWGENTKGQLGTGTTTLRELLPTRVPGLEHVKKVYAFFQGTCALLSDGTLRCWGENGFGQLAQGDTAREFIALPIEPLGLGLVLDMAVGDRSLCALLPGGDVRCWGRNNLAQTGNGGTSEHVSAPTLVPNLKAVMVHALDNAYCAVTDEADVRCWGSNQNNVLNVSPSANPVLKPSPVANLERVVSFRAGGLNACARTRGDINVCWGSNQYGQLGNGSATPTPPSTPVEFPSF